MPTKPKRPTKKPAPTKAKKPEPKPQDGQKRLLIRLGPRMLAELEEIHERYVRENELNPRSYGVSSLIRDIIRRDLERRRKSAVRR